MAGVTGLEPATSGVTGRRSNQLSYTPRKNRSFTPRGKSRRFSDVAVRLSSGLNSNLRPLMRQKHFCRPAGIAPCLIHTHFWLVLSENNHKGARFMKLDQIILVLVIIVAVIWVGTMVAGMVAMTPWGLLGLIPLAIVLAILGRVIYQRLNNAEDDYYEKNVDK